ncbi:fatty acid desaturase [uncultured Tateyamaria sp.]|uniref:fatty acid desaturase n=1 Tax=Tateyamaria sp. 1078 TaxID=3417464 RepID=UPI00261F715E|nr:fatty acid desaturase [uncultured Tateyamaria sp.]
MSPRAATRHVPAALPYRIEWITAALFVLCLLALWLGVWVLAAIPLVATFVVVLALVLHASLSHEVLHGHPFPSRKVNEALVIVNPGLFIPYIRFRDTHLAHHQDANLTDPYDDPETNYLDPVVWAALPRWRRRLLAWNNTLLGRMAIGPLVAQAAFMAADWRAIRGGDRQVLLGWAVHVPGVAIVLTVIAAAPMALWHYVLCSYVAVSILKIRTFLEHQAHDKARGRTVIVEDRGLLAFLFLNNNFHVVHHMHPRVPWYRLPALYAAHKARYLGCNDGYRYGSYAEVFARYALTAKDPVAHPLWPSPKG